jgi:hypothetical protein
MPSQAFQVTHLAPCSQTRLDNLKRMLHAKAFHLFRTERDLLPVAKQYYRQLGRGAIFVKFRDANELMKKQMRLILLYLPLDRCATFMTYPELSEHLSVYDPASEYVLLLTVSTPLVDGGELLQVSTARTAPLEGAIVEEDMEVETPNRLRLVDPCSKEAEDLLDCASTFESRADMETAAEFCAYCYQVRPVFKCARCSFSFYCGKACQREHWKDGHKQACAGKI